MQKIIMMQGGVETLDFFSRQMAETFEKSGLLVFYYNLLKPYESTRGMKAFIEKGNTALVTFNFEGLEKENGVYSKKTGYIWDLYEIPCFNIVVDHPYYYENRLLELPKLYRHISIDRNHEKYFKRYYPEYRHEAFIPLAGCNPYPEKPLKNIEDRHIQVLMTGNYNPLSFSESFIDEKGGEYGDFYREIIEDLLANPDLTMEETAIKHCTRELGELDDYTMRKIMSQMIFVDMYIRNYLRGKVVKTLASAGIPVTIIGRGWESIQAENKGQITLYGMQNSIACLESQRDAKITLNVMPWFRDGSHDRVWNAVINGSLSLSDKSLYQMEQLHEGEAVVYYDRKYLYKLPDIVSGLLADADCMQNMVDKGKPIVEKNHTWKNRAEAVMKLFL